MSTLTPLSPTRLKILRFIWQHQQMFGFSPNYREIESEVELNTVSAVSYQIDQLKQTGYVDKVKQIARSVTLTDKARKLFDQVEEQSDTTQAAISLPIMGIIQAGTRSISLPKPKKKMFL